MRKYEFTGETKETSILSRVTTLHRVRAIVDFGHVKAGEVGGWIEKEENLSHNGLAWVCDDAIVYGNAIVCDNAIVRDDAIVSDNAWVCDNAIVRDDATVSNNAIVSDNAIVRDNAEISDNVWVNGDAIICGNTCVCTNARICDNAMVSSTNHILVIGPIGSRDDFITFYHDKENDITVRIGCFNGKIDKFLEKVSQTHGGSKHELTYQAAAELAKLQIDVSL